MTEEDKKILSSFESQLNRLLFLYDGLRRENSELKRLLENKNLENETLRAQYEELNKRYANMKTAAAINLNYSDVRETKLRLSKLVREIDKCIALINE